MPRCTPCVITPLGSPWDGPNVLFDHSVRRTVGGPAVCGRGVPGVGVYRVGTREGYYPPSIPPWTHDWYCQGPTTASSRHYRVPRALQAAARPSAHPGSRTRRYGPLRLIRARFRVIYPKVSRNPECHRNSLMRPVMLPVSKKRPISHDLEFLRFLYSVAFSPKE